MTLKENVVQSEGVLALSRAGEMQVCLEKHLLRALDFKGRSLDALEKSIGNLGLADTKQASRVALFPPTSQFLSKFH